MPTKPLETYQFDVQSNNQSMKVIIPKSDDESYDNYLIEAETEKTRDYLNKRQRRPEKPGARENLVNQIKERQEYNRRKGQGFSKKYF